MGRRGEERTEDPLGQSSSLGALSLEGPVESGGISKFLALCCARRHPPDLLTRPSAREYIPLLPLWTCFPVFFLSFNILELASSGHTPVTQAKALQILINMKSVLSLDSCVKAYDIPSCWSHWRTVCP